MNQGDWAGLGPRLERTASVPGWGLSPVSVHTGTPCEFPNVSGDGRAALEIAGDALLKGPQPRVSAGRRRRWSVRHAHHCSPTVPVARW
jgi:hypothetical protein